MTCKYCYYKSELRFLQTTLELLRSEHPEDLKAVESHLNRIRSSCIEEVSNAVSMFGSVIYILSYQTDLNVESCFAIQTNDPVIEAPEANFMKLVQGLIEDTDGREHFLKVK